MRLRTSGDSAPWHRVRRDHEPVPLSIGMHEAPTVPKNCAILCGSATVMGLAGVAGLESRPSLSDELRAVMEADEEVSPGWSPGLR